MQKLSIAQPGDKQLLRDISQLAIPTVLEGLLLTLVQYVDTAMVGSLGAVATAAVAVNAAPTWLLNGIMTSVGVGGTAIVARAIGARHPAEAEEATFHMLLSGAVLATLMFGLYMLLSSVLPHWMGAEEAVRPLATSYLRILALGFIPQYIGVVLASALRGSGDMKTPMLYSVLINIINLIGNYLLIYPTRAVSFFGLSLAMPGAGLGVAGAAISSAVANALFGVLIVRRLLGKHTRIRLVRHKFSKDMITRIARIGVPAAMERIAINVGQIVFARLVTSFGTSALAAHHLAISIEAIGYQPGYGMAQAATTIVGQSLGAGEKDRAYRAGILCNRLGVLLMSFAALLLLLFRTPLMGIFTPDVEVISIGSRLLILCALYQPFFAMAIVLTGALRGAGDTRVPFYVSLFTMWGLRLIVAYLCAYPLGFGVYGAWMGMWVDLFVRGLLIYARFRKGTWREARV